jgi:hypothetical protein
MRQKLLIPILFVLHLYFAAGASAQQAEFPSPPNPPLFGVDYDWIPDCSNEASPPLPPGRVNLHRPVNDNLGLPFLSQAPPDTRRGATLPAQGDVPTDVVIHNVAGVDYMISVKQVNPGQVYLDSLTRQGNYIGTGGRIVMTKINMATNAVMWQGYIDDGLGTSDLPRIHIGMGSYTVTYRYRTAAGDQIMGCQVAYVPPVGQPTWLPYVMQRISLSNGVTKPDIREYDVDYDNNFGFAVVARSYNAVTGTSAIYAQYVDLFWGPVWNLADWFTVNTGAAGGNNTATNKWCPLVRWNYVKGLYVFAWGDKVIAPNTIMVQEITPFGVLSYLPGGNFLPPVALTADQEFYMEPCRGYVFGGVDLGLTFFFFGDNVGNLQLLGFPLSGATGWLVNNAALPTGVPYALHAYPSTPTVDNPCVLYEPFAASVTFTMASVTGLVPPWSSIPAVPWAPASDRWKSFLGSNASGIWAAIPNNGSEQIYRIPAGGGVWSTPQTVNTRNYPPAGAETDAYFAASLTTTKLGLSQYEYGFDGNGALFAARFTPQDQETDENPRERPFTNTSYSNRTYNVSNIFPYFTAAASREVETYKLQTGAHSSIFSRAAGDQARATVYEEWKRNGSCDIKIMFSDPTGVDIVSTVALGTSTIGYTRPKVAIVHDGTDFQAIVTYVMVNIPGNQTFYYSNLWNLSTNLGGGSTLRDIGYSGHRDGYHNEAVVHDKNSSADTRLFTFWKMTGPGTEEIQVMGFYWDGTPITTWLSNPFVVRASSATAKDQIKACHNPDPALNASGQYIVWRESNVFGSTINLTAVSSIVGTVWGAGTIIHTPALANNRGEPAVTADANGVFVVWRDQQFGAGVNWIYGAAWDNTGVILPAWNFNGVNLNTTIPGVYNSLLYDAEMPDVAMLPNIYFGQRRAAVVFNESEGNGFVAPRRIGYLEVDLATATVTVQNHFAMPARNYPPSMTSSDATESMFGFFQRRPKIMKMDQSTVAAEGYMPREYMFAAFETAAYPLTNPSYAAITGVENARAALNEPRFIENSIVGALVAPGSGGMVDRFSIARIEGAQDLDQIVYDTVQGFMVTYTDYRGGNGYAGIAKLVDANSEMRDHWDVFNHTASDDYNIQWSLVGTPSATVTNDVRLYNNSLIDLVIHPSTMSNTAASGGHITWGINGLSLNNDFTISGDDIGTDRDYDLSITYDPDEIAIPSLHDDDLTIHLRPHKNSLIWMYDILPIYGKLGASGTGSYKIIGGRGANSTNLSLDVSQNPAGSSTSALIKGIRDHQVTLKLYDMLGREMIGTRYLTMSGSEITESLDLSPLTTGSYILVAEQDTGDRVQLTLIKQ